jgi:hypothetical protein
MQIPTKPCNPWVKIGSQAPFVLQEDKPYIEAFNSIHGHNDDRRINLCYTPEPRLGPVNAQVVLLQLNPSYSKKEPNGPQSEQLISRELESIKDENHPHLGVIEDNRWWHGNRWWNRTLKQLLNKPEIGRERLAQRICSIEFFPYRSITFCHGHVRFPSQEYTFDLVRDRLSSGALIIVTRAYPLWVLGLCDSRIGGTIKQNRFHHQQSA